MNIEKRILILKNSNVYKFVGAGVLAASLSIASLTKPAVAQTNSSNTGTYDTTREDVNNTRDNDSNLGWLGLLGLAGLAGLAKKKGNDRVSSRDRDDVMTSGGTRR